MFAILLIMTSFISIGCGNTYKTQLINIPGYVLEYRWNIEFENLWLKDDDREEIIGLYQEVWDNIVYRDSLLIAEKYREWMWINAFVQDNLNILEDQWLTLSNVKKTQIWIINGQELKNAVLLEYEITQWFIEEIPVLYMAQLFIPDGEGVILVSFSSEELSSRNAASNMFKNIK